MNARTEPNLSRGITGLGAEGFKSLRDPQEITVGPLTVLAGVNSSGKSSVIQPLLLLKQTLEAPYDPGPLLLDGPNVSVTRIEQILSLGTQAEPAVEHFSIQTRLGTDSPITLRFGRSQSGDIQLIDTTLIIDGRRLILKEVMTDQELSAFFPSRLAGALGKFTPETPISKWKITRDRWSLQLEANVANPDSGAKVSISFNSGILDLEQEVARLVHLPALRGNPRRTYRTTAVEGQFPGVFNEYTAGVISAWQNRSNKDKLTQLSAGLERLGLTSVVQAKQLDDTSVELLVGRLPNSRRSDLVNIADVGFGVSQTLPVVVALLAARPGQLVYLEQPEIHLHPRAQAEFAELLAEAVDRGVRVVVETHSSLLLRAIQTLVARRRISVGNVILHWFSRDTETGYTSIASTELDRLGSFGDWPEDFDEVNLRTDHEYLTAAEEAEGSASE